MLRPMQGHSAPPATSTTHQLAAQPRKVRLSFRKRSPDVEKAVQYDWRFATTASASPLAEPSEVGPKSAPSGIAVVTPPPSPQAEAGSKSATPGSEPSAVSESVSVVGPAATTGHRDGNARSRIDPQPHQRPYRGGQHPKPNLPLIRRLPPMNSYPPTSYHHLPPLVKKQKPQEANKKIHRPVQRGGTDRADRGDRSDRARARSDRARDRSDRRRLLAATGRELAAIGRELAAIGREIAAIGARDRSDRARARSDRARARSDRARDRSDRGARSQR